MTTEEKVKAYDDALEKAREIKEKIMYSHLSTESCKAVSEYIDTIIPELAESDDERIRKAIIEIVRCFVWHDRFEPVTKEDCIAWLEKQKVKVYNGTPYYTPEEVNAKIDEPINVIPKIPRQEYLYHLLANGIITFSDYTYLIAKKPFDYECANIPQKDYTPVEQKHYWKPTETDVALFNKAVTTNKALTPTERAQLDIIRSKFGHCRAVNCSGIAQNGEDEECTDFTIYHPLKNAKGEYECIPYSFYGSLTSFSEDKDLIDFLRTCFYTEEECNEWIEQQKEQKPDTEELVYRLNGLMQEYIKEGKDDEEREHRLKCYQLFWDALGDSLFFEEQKPAEWSEEDEKIMNTLLVYINSHSTLTCGNGVKKEDFLYLLNKLKSLKLQPKVEWSEEDKKLLNYAISLTDDAQVKRFLKSLKPQAKQEDLPKWRKVDSQYQYSAGITREMDVNGDYQYCISTGKIYDGCEYISLAELEKLPKEE